MYYVGLRAHRRHIYVIYVHDLPSNQQQVTHVWKPSTTFMNLTVQEIKDSVTRAQEINYLTTLKQAYDDLPVLDTLIEPWLPEVKEPELPQAIDLEALNELLTGEVTQQKEL